MSHIALRMNKIIESLQTMKGMFYDELVQYDEWQVFLWLFSAHEYLTDKTNKN